MRDSVRAGMGERLFGAILATAALAIFCAQCAIGDDGSVFQQSERDMSKDLRQHLDDISRTVVDLTSAGSLFGSREFLLVYENPLDYLYEASVLLQDPQVPDREKAILGFMMQRLPFKEYLKWLNFGLAVTEADRLPVAVLESMIFPSMSWSTRLEENYTDPQVRSLLARVVALQKLKPEWRRYIVEDLLSGKAREDALNLREAGQIP